MTSCFGAELWARFLPEEAELPFFIALAWKQTRTKLVHLYLSRTHLSRTHLSRTHLNWTHLKL